MNDKMKAIREVFGPPDVFTIRPTTFGEMNPVVEHKRNAEMEEDSQKK